jgi:hypothetical protein
MSIKNDDDLDKALKNLLDQGLIREEMIDGKPHYSMTNIGKQVFVQNKSDPKSRN